MTNHENWASRTQRLRVYRHNAMVGSIVRAMRFVQMLWAESLTADACHHLLEAERHLILAVREAKMRRLEENGEVTDVYTYENGVYVKVERKKSK